MDVENMIGSIIRGAVVGGRKRRRGASRYLSGGRGSFLNGSTLLALAGLAWGVYETATSQNPSGAGGSGSAAPGAGTGGIPAQGHAAGTPAVTPPPLPVVPRSPALVPAEVPDAVLRLVRLTISAARADGVLSPEEEAAILEHARAAGAEAIVGRELKSSFTLAQIVAGVSDPRQRQELYTLAFAIVRGDEQVTGGERVYLAQLAHQLGLDAADVTRLEQSAVERITEAERAEAADGAPPAGA